ncbi:MAG: hypothetical protein KF878_10115 [Planctomycetes bacterium]|nr:hypothetical protein [Planctomycetota bacterium]
MAEVDPLAALPLAPDERVLWVGRAAVGVPWPPAPDLLRRAGALWERLARAVGFALLAALAGTWLGLVRAWTPGQLVSLAAFGLLVAGLVILVGVALLRATARVGPFYVALPVLALWGAAFAGHWTTLMARHGWHGAVERLRPDDLLAAALLIGLPLARIAWGVTCRLEMRHVITTRRVVMLRRGRFVWSRPVETLRLEHPWRAPAGLLVVGEGRERRTLPLADADPAHVLAEVQAARGGDPARS